MNAGPTDPEHQVSRPVPGHEIEHLDVVVVGAGLSGVAAGHYLQEHCPWASYAILEGRDAIGGTWDLFRYPGIRSDSDMFTLGYGFRPWRKKHSIADGADIRGYIEDTAAEEGIDTKIRFGRRVLTADWSTPESRWHLTVANADSDEVEQLTAGFLFSCTGYYRYDRGHTPQFEGIDRFTGTVVHPQLWPDDLDHADRRVVVIGSGATAVTLIPAMAAEAAHVTMLQRSPSYVAAIPPVSPVAGLLERILPTRWSASATRWFHALTTQWFYAFCRRFPGAAKRMLRKGFEMSLPDGYDIDTHFTPHYDPWDQRLCIAPNGDFFTAIREGDASVVTDRVQTFTETGILTESGRHLEADIVITATGLELLFLGGIDLSVDGETVDPSSCLTYRGMMLEGVPNLAMAVGYTNASWTLKCELTCDYVGRLLSTMHAQGRTQCTPTNADASVDPEPLLSLNAGYVQRSAHLFPRQGSRAPWRVHQSYWRDYRAMKLGRLVDDALVLSGPARGTAADGGSTTSPLAGSGVR